MVTCEICNKEYKHINGRHVASHGITFSEYKIKYPNAKTISNETRKRISTSSKGKPHNTDNLKLWWTPERRAEMSLARSGKNNPSFGTHHSKEHIDKMLESRKNGNWIKSIRQSNSKPKSVETKKKLSISVSNLLASGEISHGRNKHKKGWYISSISGNSEYYESSYELIRMQQLDDLKLHWTKKHKIRIEYINEFGNYANYVPDFLVESNIIEEIKPKELLNKNNNQLKFTAAIEYCKLHNLTFSILTEMELGL